MKTIFKVALTLGLASFAFFASAQNPSANTQPRTSMSAAVEVDSAQVDFVTVGSTMPYSTNLEQADFNTWLANATDWLLTNATNIDNVARWSVQRTHSAVGASMPGAPIVSLDADDQSDIYITWPEVGAFRLTLTNSLDGADCDDAVSTKTVFVLPAPTIVGTTATVGNNVVLGCTETTHTVQFLARGIGQLQAQYTLFRRPITGTIEESVEISVADGTAITDTAWFRTTGFAEALMHYNSTAGEATVTMNFTNLQPGYVYRVRVTGVSDQISRKSFDQDLAFRPLATAVYAVFAVVPEVTSTQIDHVSNIFGQSPRPATTPVTPTP